MFKSLVCSPRAFGVWALLLSVLVMPQRATAQMGHVLEAVGPVNQSMGGAGTALPLDAMGALQWNPASISGLRCSEFGFGAMLFSPQTELSSSIDANTFGPGFPPAPIGGSTASDTDMSPIPSFGFVRHDPLSPWTFGLGGFAIGGFGVDFPASATNPILTPQPPDGGMGFGPITSEFQLMQFCPTISRQFSSGWSVGFAPTFNWASLSVSPFSAASPDANGRYNSGSAADAVMGAGFQIGAYFEDPCSPWSFGASYKSTQWFQDFKINSIDSTNTPRQLVMDLDYPSIISLGTAYSGFDRFRIAWDIRYIDYANTDGFQSAGFDATGAVTGFGWSSIWATAIGVEYAITRNFHWRVGYTFNESPIDQSVMFFNSPAPALVQHHLSTGFTKEFSDGWRLSAAFKYGFENSVSGPWHAPGIGPVPGTNIEASLATYGLSFGISKRF